MLIDCGTCRGRAEDRCGGCVVTVLAGMPLPSPRSHPISHPHHNAYAGLLPDDAMGSPPLSADAEADESLPLDRTEAAAVQSFVRAGLIGSHEAARLHAQRQTWRRHRAVG